MKRDRDRPRQGQAWERISWDEAYDIIVAQVSRDVARNYGTDSDIACGRARAARRAHTRFHACNAGVRTAEQAVPCQRRLVVHHAPRQTAMAWMLGRRLRRWTDGAFGFRGPLRRPALRSCPKYMLVWGRNPLWSATPTACSGTAIIDMMKRGMKLIVADPRAQLARHACGEYHLQLRPGTDARAGAWPLLNVVIDEDLYDHEFVENWCYGFDELRASACRPCTPEMAGENHRVPSRGHPAAARPMPGVRSPPPLPVGRGRGPEPERPADRRTPSAGLVRASRGNLDDARRRHVMGRRMLGHRRNSTGTLAAWA